MSAVEQSAGTSAAVEPSSTTGVKELGHIVLYVRNAERSAHFYRDVLGWNQLQPSDGNADRRIAIFSGGRTHHELLLIEVGEDAQPQPHGRHLGMYHFGLKVGDSDEELVAMAKRLRAVATPIVGSTDHGVTHSLYILDPDGNEIELYIDVPGVQWSGFDAVAQAPKPLRISLGG